MNKHVAFIMAVLFGLISGLLATLLLYKGRPLAFISVVFTVLAVTLIGTALHQDWEYRRTHRKP